MSKAVLFLIAAAGAFSLAGAAFDPSNPAASGYSIVFQDDFTTLNTISLSVADLPGYKWYTDDYVYGNTTDAADFALVSGGGLTITPDNGEQYAMASANLPYGGPGGGHIYTSAINGQPWSDTLTPALVGYVFCKGWYVEASIAFEGSAIPTDMSKGWPAFWTFPIEKGGALEGRQWPGQASNYDEIVEDDIFECFSDVAVSSIHDWFGTTGSYMAISNNGGNLIYSAPPSTWHAGAFHKVQQLWVAGSTASSGAGSITNYLDNTSTSTGVNWVDATTTKVPPPSGTYKYSRMDGQHNYLICGGAMGMPITFKYIKVWQLGGTSAVSQPMVSSDKSFSCNTIARTVRYTLPKPCFVSIKYFDLQGKTVCSFVNSFQQAGQYSVNAPSSLGNMYVQEFKAGDFVKKERIAISK